MLQAFFDFIPKKVKENRSRVWWKILTCSLLHHHGLGLGDMIEKKISTGNTLLYTKMIENLFLITKPHQSQPCFAIIFTGLSLELLQFFHQSNQHAE